ncbi:hypothetical protein LCGC14_3154060, partial [marine sediment metagenome]
MLKFPQSIPRTPVLGICKGLDMREVKPLANEAKDLLDKAIILIQEHFNDKAGAAEERGRQDVQE